MCGLNFSAVNVDTVTQGLESIKTDTNRQDDMQRIPTRRLRNAENGFKRIDKKIEIFEKEKDAQINCKA